MEFNNEPTEDDITPKYFTINKSHPLYKDLVFCNLFPNIDFLDNPENLPKMTTGEILYGPGYKHG